MYRSVSTITHYEYFKIRIVFITSFFQYHLLVVFHSFTLKKLGVHSLHNSLTGIKSASLTSDFVKKWGTKV